MKRVCLLCGRTSPDSNLFCQETYCPAEMSPTILDYGDWFGDIEIVRPIAVLRSSVLYEANHQKKRVLMKVAHPGPENKERLKHEAEILQALQAKGQTTPTLPALLPPYANTTMAQDAYGKTMLQSHLLYFYLFEHFEGETLRDVLSKNPQLWINHVGWLTMSLAATVNMLHLQGHYHYGLSPDCILVRFDENPSVPRILLFDLGIASSKETLAHNWYPFFALPAYTAPELVNSDGGRIVPDYRTDVYGIGLVLYEMLVGQPPFRYELRGDADVYRAVERSERVRMNRTEDVDKVAQVALKATEPDIAFRQRFAADVAEELKALFGNVPEPKKRRRPSLNAVLGIAVALLAIAFLIALALILQG
jgi:serine/threonine protein kinase